MIQSGWLTPYQVNQLFQGQGNTLVLGHIASWNGSAKAAWARCSRPGTTPWAGVVALKVIRKDRLGDPEAVKRFRREMHMAGQLSHPNVVNAFDADAVNGTPLLCHGIRRRHRPGPAGARRGRLPIPAPANCIRQAALGLQHAHEKGMVHRDIKPSNLLVSKAPGGVVVKILDMGLARVQASQQEDTTMLSQDGSVIGTPDFMAPEQAKNSSTVDDRADIYSLGCTFYYLLTGKPPFTGGSNIEKLLKHQMDPPPPIEKLRPDVPEGVRLLLQQMLAKKPEDRVQTAGTVAVRAGTVLQAGHRGGQRQGNRPADEPAGRCAGEHAGRHERATITGQGAGVDGSRSWRSPSGAMRPRGNDGWPSASCAGVCLIGIFGLILMLASGGGSKTSPANASSPPPTTALITTPATEHKPPASESVGRFLFPETTVVVSFNMAQLRKTEVYRQHEEQVKSLFWPFLGQWEQFGDGFMANADRFTIAYPQQ